MWKAGVIASCPRMVYYKMVGLDKTVAPAAAAAVLAVAMCDIGTMHVATEVFARKENEVDLLADLLADPMDPTDPLTTRRTRKTAGWRRNAPSLRHRGATDANGVTGLAGVADAADGSFCEKENEVDLLADPTDPLATRRTRKTVGWRRNAPVLRHRGATGAAGVAGLAGVADATDGRVHEKEN